MEMTALQLIETLQELLTLIGGEDVPVRLATQPHWPFECSIGETDVVIARDRADQEVIYIGQKEQLGYLPEEARIELGW